MNEQQANSGDDSQQKVIRITETITYAIIVKHRHTRVAIIGAGIAGLLAARVFEDLDFQISLFEAGDSIRGIGAEIGLASNAMCALKDLGVAAKIRELGNRVEEFGIYDPSGKMLFEIDTGRIEKTYQEKSYAIHRAVLHKLLLNRLEGVEVELSKRLERINMDSEKVRLSFQDGTRSEFDFVIGADGIHSATRKQLVPDSIERYAGYWCWRCIAQVPMNFMTQGRALWGKKGRFGIKRMGSNRVYWFACINTPLEGTIRNYKLSDLKARFKDYKTVSQLLQYSREEDVISDAVYDINPLERFLYGRVLLIGDAAHATTPNMGQGAGMAVEDVAILKEELENHEIEIAFRRFEQRRLMRTAYIIKSSRRAGSVAQMDKPVGIAIRNWAFRNLPVTLMQAPLKRLYDEDYRKL